MEYVKVVIPPQGPIIFSFQVAALYKAAYRGPEVHLSFLDANGQELWVGYTLNASIAKEKCGSYQDYRVELTEVRSVVLKRAKAISIRLQGSTVETARCP